MPDYNPYELTWPTDECDETCQGLCGYCPKHEKAIQTENGDYFLGPDPQQPIYLRNNDYYEKETVWISTEFSTYPKLRYMETIQKRGDKEIIRKSIKYGRSRMETSAPFNFVFEHDAGVPAIAIQNNEENSFGIQNLFGIKPTTLLFTVGCKCWKH